MVYVLDNYTDDTRLGNKILEYFEHFECVDIATGYFNLRGWRVFVDAVDDKIAARAASGNPVVRGGEPVARILVGMVRRSEHEELVREYRQQMADQENVTDRSGARSSRSALIRVLREQLTQGIPTNEDRQTLQRLHQQVQCGAVQLKVYCRQPLHGKTYLLRRQDPANPVSAFVGSSNLTYPGLMTNLELNVDLNDKLPALAVSTWFDGLWGDTWALPINDELLAVLDQSWASPNPRSPYEVYLKVCYDLSRDVREGLSEYSLHGRIKDELLEYQSTAVKTLARRIMTRGGTMLGDVVGLGKTLTAIAVALMLRDEHGYQPLVVCPKNLVRMWEEHLEAYDLYGKVVPYSMSHTLGDLRRYKFVIVDESHTLRNHETQAYQNLARYIQENDSKALLLTATPFNTRYADVANQLGLFIDEDEDLGVQPSVALKNHDFADKLEFGVSTLAAFRKSEEPEDWKRLMGEHLVRRTRSFIRDNYGQRDANGRQFLTFANGQRFFFPQRRAIPIDHSFGGDDPAVLMTQDVTLDGLAALKLPRYDLFQYVVPSQAKAATQDESRILRDIEQSRGNVTGFVRTSFFKRLSSCGHSFILSLQRHVERNRLFMYALDHDLPVPVGTIDAPAFASDDDGGQGEVSGEGFVCGHPDGDYSAQYQRLRDEDDRRAADRKQFGWLRASLFQQRLRDVLEQDTQIIEGLLASYGQWSYEADSKLRTLVDLAMNTHAGEKILVFTEYKDTAEYLAGALRACGVDGVGVATGDTDDPTAVACRFSPRSNARLLAQGGHYSHDSLGSELRVLVATDVLSEGQNLQDAHIVVNYDIPWAIIQLIQRAGRVDRVGQASDEVLIYTLTHGDVEDVLHLRQRVQQRLTDNAATFGSDESFFDTDEEVNVIRDLYEGKMDDVATEDDVDATSLAFEVWNRVAQADPDLAERIAQMPDMVDATRRARLAEEDAVLCYVQTESGIDGFARASADPSHHGGQNSGSPRVELLTGHEALRAFEASPHEPGLDRIDSHDDWVMAMVKGDSPLKQAQDIAGRLRGERKILWNRLGNQLPVGLDRATQDAVEALYQWPLTASARMRVQRLRRRGASNDELLEELRALHVRGELSVSGSRGEDPFHIVSVMGVRNV